MPHAIDKRPFSYMRQLKHLNTSEEQRYAIGKPDVLTQRSQR